MDGSDTGKAFAGYLRYSCMGSTKHKVSLVAAKSKINRSGGQSTPCSELDGHTLGGRGARNITRALQEKIEQNFMLGDSRSILHSLKAGAAPLNEWFANRLGEIYDCMATIPDTVPVTWAMGVAGVRSEWSRHCQQS